MPKAIVAIALAAVFAAATGAYAAPVRTQQGMLEGVETDGIVSWRGVAFAAPPVGPLRWRAPQPPARWSGVRTAERDGAMCMQAYNAADKGVGPLPMGEDCLTLNVFAPKAAKGLPVMVWIHGGGFVNGSGTARLYDGSDLARRGVVVVSLNYRLGRFGFFAHPALSAAKPRGEPTGNFGLMDQIAALKWVQANIAAFGGDPRQVTIFGESAGGISVNDLMVSPAAKGLFVRAIVQSGAGRENAVPLAEAEAAGAAFAKAKLDLADATAAQLRAVPAETLLKAGDPDLFTGGGPMVDGRILTGTVHAGFAAGREAKVPYILGYNDVEFPVPAAGLADWLKRFPDLDAAAQAKVAAAYPDRAAYETRIVSDLFFSEPALELARLHARNGAPTWLYRFSVLSPAVQGRLKGAPHASERQYVFGRLDQSAWPTTQNDEAQSATMMAYWTAFARTGDPNGPGRPAWPRYSAARDQLLEFTNDGPVARTPPLRPALDAVAGLYADGR